MTKEEVQDKVNYYNSEIKRLMRERKQLMDESMSLFADAQVGEKAYTYDGKYLGIVRELYRVNANNALYDTSMWVHYRFEDGDNTSRRSIVGVINEVEYKRRKLVEAKRLIAEYES